MPRWIMHECPQANPMHDPAVDKGLAANRSATGATRLPLSWVTLRM